MEKNPKKQTPPVKVDDAEVKDFVFDLQDKYNEKFEQPGGMLAVAVDPDFARRALKKGKTAQELVDQMLER